MMSEVFSRSFRNRVIGLYGFLAFVNIGAWIWVMLAFHDKPFLLGTALLAYTFGLRHAWHMYPVGFLFGLGFDTATEVAILGLSAAAATKGLSVGSMAVFPVLFTAGMTSLVSATPD
jgi:high-affinity nickel permease